MTALFKVEVGLERILSLDHRYLGTQGTSHALLKQVNCTSCDKESSQPERVRRHNMRAHGSTSFGRMFPVERCPLITESNKTLT